MNTFEKPVIWFRATDIPLRKDNPFQIAEKSQSKSPIVWERFSDTDSALLEQAFLDFKSNPKIASPIALPYALDGLFEVNISTREVYPIYWDGPIFEVRRGIWFEPKGIFQIKYFNQLERIFLYSLRGEYNSPTGGWFKEIFTASCR
jgi:hypothetical protein